MWNDEILETSSSLLVPGGCEEMSKKTQKTPTHKTVPDNRQAMVGGEAAALRAGGPRTPRCRRNHGPSPALAAGSPLSARAPPAWAPRSAPSVPPAPRVQPARQPRGASARGGPAAIPPCAAAAAASGRCAGAAERIKAAGQAPRVLVSVGVCPCVRDSRSARPVRPRDAGAERRPPPASPARGAAAAAGVRLHLGGRCPRLQRGRRRLAEPGGVLGRGSRQPAAGTRRAGGRGAGAAGSSPGAGPRGRCLRSRGRPGPGHGGRGAGKVRAGGQRRLRARGEGTDTPGRAGWRGSPACRSRCLGALGAPLPPVVRPLQAGRAGLGPGLERALRSLSRPVPKAIPRDGRSGAGPWRGWEPRRKVTS